MRNHLSKNRPGLPQKSSETQCTTLLVNRRRGPNDPTAHRGRGPKDPAAQEVKGVATPLASTRLLRQLLGCGQKLLELSLCSARSSPSWEGPAAIVPPSVAGLFGGVSLRSAYARFFSLISNENAAEFVAYGFLARSGL